MSKEGAEQIKAKIQELSALIKEEAGEESSELINEIKESVDELKQQLGKLGNSAKGKYERSFISDLKDDIELLVDETHIKDFLHDAKEDVNAIIGETHVKDVADDAKKDFKSILGSTNIQEFFKDAQDDLNALVKELDAKALKAQYSIQEKYSDTKIKKNEVVVESADALVDAINKFKCALAECEKPE